MKKTLALILAIVMVFALATTAFAAGETTTKDIVGTLNKDKANSTAGVASGVEDITSNPPEISVAIKATAGDTQHRYAVDIVFPTINLEVAEGNLIWDVSTLTYIQDPDATHAIDNQAFSFTVTNYSDLPVNLGTSIAYPVTADKDADSLDLVLYKGNVSVNTAGDVTDAEGAPGVELNPTERIEKANIRAATPFYFTLVAKSADWPAVVNYYVTKIGNGTSYTIANLNVTISAVSTQNG